MSRVVKKETLYKYISMSQKSDLEFLISLVSIETTYVELVLSFDFKSR